ncbi:MAG: S41 family peptidase [Paludibacteraceae bacterium]|nr:S41 family peptidase [Paludibacteraceae bacterium]
MMKKLLLIAGCLGCLTALAEQPIRTVDINKSIHIYNDVMRQLDINYVDTLDYEDLLETGINAMLSHVDPYTTYIPKKDDDNLKMMTTGKYGGIGAIIMQRDSVVVISEPYLGMPAQVNGVLAGDTILEVDGMKCFRKSTKEVSDKLRGKADTQVKLVLKRYGEKKTIVKEFDRKEIHLPSVGYYTTLPDSLAKNTGYILFSEFTSNSSREFLSAVDKMVTNDHIERLVIDLRGNGGGIIDEAIQIVGYFVEKGTEIVTTKGKTESSNRSYKTSTNPIYAQMPLVVLVDHNTASAAEIVSGGLQDLKRATLIGQRTFGKGLVQSIRPIAYDGHLKVTTAHYYLPSGRCIQAIDYAERQKGRTVKRDTAGGILPDIVIDDSAKLDIAYSLYAKQMFFDYATRYHHTHPQIASATDFELTQAEIEDFIAFLDEKHFTYETETSKYLKQTLDVARHEDIDSTTLQAIEALEPLLKPSYKDAIMRNMDAIKEALGAEIVERYYFQEGRIAFMLRFDKELRKAIDSFDTNANKE